MMEELEARLAQDGIEFKAKHARGRCLPHTVHLAALKVGQAIIILVKEPL